MEHARQIERHRSGGTAVEIRLSGLRGKVTQGNILFAINMFRSMVDQNHGRLYVLDNSDLVFVYRGLLVQDLKSAVEKLRLLYSEQLLADDEARSGRSFIIWYNLSTDPEAFRRAMERLAGGDAPVQPVVGQSAAAAAPAPTVPTDTSPAARLAAAAQALERVRIRTVLRQQPILRIAPGAAPAQLFREVYVSIPDIEALICPGARLTEERWLFQYFTQLLDHRVMLYLRDSDDPTLGGNFSLNLNMSSVLTADFRSFGDVLGEPGRSTVVIELQKADVFADLGSYIYVRDLLRERGFRVCLDGVTELSLPFIEVPRLGLDFLKLRWNPEVGPEGLESCRRELARRSPGASCKVILCRVDSQEAVAFGHSAGVELFQGRHFDPAPA